MKKEVLKVILLLFILFIPCSLGASEKYEYKGEATPEKNRRYIQSLDTYLQEKISWIENKFKNIDYRLKKLEAGVENLEYKFNYHLGKKQKKD